MRTGYLIKIHEETGKYKFTKGLLQGCKIDVLP
jgi:hypothetical protein